MRSSQLKRRPSRSSSQFQYVDTRRGTHIGLRQVECKRAPFSHIAAQLDLAAEQTGEFAADGQSESRAAVLTAGPRVSLLKGLKNDPLFFRWNSDAGILDPERDHGWRCAKDCMIFAPAALRQGYRQAHTSLLGEFESVGEQILKYLLQSFRIGDQAATESRIGPYFKCKPAILRFGSEWTGNHVQQTCKENFLRLNGNRARLNF